MSSKNIDRIGNVVVDYTYYSGEDLYSEGAAEDRLLDFVMNHTASDYEEYIQSTRSWSAMYHLSHIRENVVSWLPIKEDETVLEIGSGCGAITGAFARVAKNVTCVELSKKRSLINAYRNKEYDNLTIMVGNFEAVEPNLDEKYDYISLIGVYEYAASYISGDNPYHKFLSILKNHLAPGGKIIIAIENRLGLKYFAGCKEDHLSEYFAGIMGYSEDAGVRTFSKRTLSKLLGEEGYHYRFYYPYPDYKLPHTIYSDDKLPGKGELNTNLRNFDNDRMVLFDEEKAYDSFIEEGLFPEFSNSYVVLASPDDDWDKDLIVPVYTKYANERLDKFRVNTMIAKKSSGENYVFKRALSTHANAHIEQMCNNYQRLLEQYGDTGLKPVKCTYIKGVERGTPIIGVVAKAKDIASVDYVSGITLEDYLNGLEKEGKYEKMEEIILEYCRKLNSCTDVVEYKPSVMFTKVFGKREFVKKYIATNPCNFDMIFSNIVLDKEKKDKGDWTVLDYEWVLEFAIPIQFIIYRALFYQFRDKENSGFSMYLSKKGMDVYTLCGIDIGERMLFKEMEHSFQLYIIGGVASLDVMRVLMPSATMDVEQLVRLNSYLRNLDTPKVYFSRARVFTEDNQITLIAKMDNNKISFRVPFDKYISSLRIDPTEYPCVLHIDNICYIMNDGSKQPVESVIVNGFVISNDTYLYNTNDPQIVVLDVPSEAKSLEVSYTITMLEKVFYDVILEKLEEQKRLEEEAKTKIAYRAKRKVGIIKEEVLPEGFKRVFLQ